MLRLIAGLALGWSLAAAALLLALALGRIPVAVADRPLPGQRSLTRLARAIRLHREQSRQAPLEADEANLVAAARLYRDQCANCHGLHGSPAPLGAHLAPAAPPLWEPRKQGNELAIGVSCLPIAATQWKIANGLAYTGMPAFKGTLTDHEIGQLSLLLANANRPLPPDAWRLLRNQAAHQP